MKEILDEELQEKPKLFTASLPKYMVRWHWVLLFFIFFNTIVESYKVDPVVYFKGILFTYIFICFISVLQLIHGKINEALLFSFIALCVANLFISMILLGNGIFMWMVRNMGSVPQ